MAANTIADPSRVKNTGQFMVYRVFNWQKGKRQLAINTFVVKVKY
jgi:hypothetical protein